LVPFDYTLLRETALLLYEGPWLAERLACLETWVHERAPDLLPVTRAILARGARHSAVDAFRAWHRLQALRRQMEASWTQFDVIALPTAPSIYRIDEVQERPFELNQRLGVYTNFANLLDLAALSVPSGFREDGLPFGITLYGPRDSDPELAALAERYEARSALPMGATGHRVVPRAPASRSEETRFSLCVVGAHLSGQPLNHQLTALGGRLVRACRTAPRYRLFALRGTQPAKPGLIREARGGHAIEVEVWDLPPSELGRFFGGVVAPLCIGHVELDDGSSAPGFLCEAYAVADATDISSFGGWRAYLASR
jgi:allophanate hydrolase